MSTGDLETDLTQNAGSAPRELLMWSFFFLHAALSVVTTPSTAGLLTSEATKFFMLTTPLMEVVGETASIVDSLTGTTQQVHNQKFGMLALVSATLTVIIRSAIITFPLGVATAIYLSECMNAQTRSILKPTLETFADVLIIVYGFFALIYITPAFEVIFPGIETFNMLPASIIVGIVIIPMAASVSEDAMSVVPDELRQTGYGMGTTKLDVSAGIVVPAMLFGIFSSFILALSRAIGETMVVTVAAGVQAKLLNPLNPASCFEGTLSMTTAMVRLLTGDITGDGLAHRSLSTIGLVLFVVTLVMNVTSDYVSRYYREAY